VAKAARTLIGFPPMQAGNGFNTSAVKGAGRKGDRCTFDEQVALDLAGAAPPDEIERGSAVCLLIQTASALIGGDPVHSSETVLHRRGVRLRP